MLLSLHIENVAVIKCVDIDFEKGFTALTGETGAGKSILIDSIGFLLGARGDRDLLRTGEEKAVVSAMFGDLGAESLRLLAENELSPDEDGNCCSPARSAQTGARSVRSTDVPSEPIRFARLRRR